MHQLFNAQHCLGLGQVVSQFSGVVISIVSVQIFQGLGDAGVEADFPGGG